MSARPSPWPGPVRRLAADRVAVMAAALLGGIVLLVLFGPLLSPWPYDFIDFAGDWGAAPTLASGHWFGTDELGRDLFARTCQGGRISLLVGLVATVVSLVVGVAYGAVAGYAGGRTDALMMRTVDVLYALPFMFFVVLLTVFFGRHLLLIFVAIGGVNWLDMARIVRGQTLSLRRREFVEAARVAGASPARILRRHIVPNLLGVVAVYATLTVPQVILVESFLSYLGLGVQEPATSWGALVSDGAHAMETTPWALVFPAAFLAATLLCLNFLGDALRDALEPRAQARSWARAPGLVRRRERRAASTGKPAPVPAPAGPLLSVSGLCVELAVPGGARIAVVRELSFGIDAGQTLGLVGESGSGKTQTALALLGMTAPQARLRGSIRLQGRELLGLPEPQWQRVRGRGIGLVPQEPMSSLNPYRSIGAQMADLLQWHRGASRQAARHECLRALDAVRIAGAAARLRQFPHELSGGMRQRVLIAMALLPQPLLLVADEPTTALDATVQAQVLALLQELQRGLNMALLLITHDLDAAARVCGQVLVLYAGQAVEAGPLAAVMTAPRHPYTAGLLACRPQAGAGRAALTPIPGQPPDAAALPAGCAFHPRCPRALPRCSRQAPAAPPAVASHGFACHNPVPEPGAGPG